MNVNYNTDQGRGSGKKAGLFLLDLGSELRDSCIERLSGKRAAKAKKKKKKFMINRGMKKKKSVDFPDFKG